MQNWKVLIILSLVFFFFYSRLLNLSASRNFVFFFSICFFLFFFFNYVIKVRFTVRVRVSLSLSLSFINIIYYNFKFLHFSLLFSPMITARLGVSLVVLRDYHRGWSARHLEPVYSPRIPGSEDNYPPHLFTNKLIPLWFHFSSFAGSSPNRENSNHVIFRGKVPRDLRGLTSATR